MKSILGLGNALVDILMSVEDRFVESLNFKKGSMNHIDIETAREILKRAALIKKERVTGGSVANAINALARLGVRTGYIGKIGEDEFGEFFLDEITENGITPYLSKGYHGTGTAICMIGEDSERTFATYLGAANELTADDLVPDHFTGNTYFFLEGYMVQNHQLVLKSLEMAKNAGLKIAIDLSSFNIVEENLTFLKTFIRDFVEIVFANEEEAKSFTGLSDPLLSAKELSRYCDIAVVKIGPRGSIIIHEQKTEIIIAPFLTDPVDTTGAGDFYAAGFFFGLVNGLPLGKCGIIGSFLASKVVEVIGAGLSLEKWKEIIPEINRLKN